MPSETIPVPKRKNAVLSISFLYMLTLCVAYKAVSSILYAFHADGELTWLVYGVTLAIVGLGARTSYAETTRSFKILLRSITSIVLLYIVFSNIHYPDSLTSGNATTYFELNVLWWIATVCGLIGLVRPSFAIVPLIFVVWYKYQTSYLFGLNVSPLDYTAVIETGIVLVVGLLVVPLFRRFADLDAQLEQETRTESTAAMRGTARLDPIDLLVLTAVALHFGNYFYAALIKAGLGDNPLYWVLENQTQYLILAAERLNALPISFSEWLTSLSIEGFTNLRLVVNLATISIQFFAAIALIRIRWAIIITVIYDIFHLGIFVLTGIFFWKFILLNLSIVAALTPIRHVVLSQSNRRVLVTTVLLSPLIFQILPSFAWLDSRSMNHVRILAVTDDNRELEVPSNYFLGLSVTFAQQRLVWPKHGPFPTWTWGTTRIQEDMERGLECDWPLKGDAPRETAYYLPQAQITDVIRKHHALILHNLNSDGRIAYDWYPHHIFSMPWRSQEFNALDKRRIVAYRYVVDAVCMDHIDGTPRYDTKWSASFDIPIANRP